MLLWSMCYCCTPLLCLPPPPRVHQTGGQERGRGDAVGGKALCLCNHIYDIYYLFITLYYCGMNHV